MILLLLTIACCSLVTAFHSELFDLHHVNNWNLFKDSFGKLYNDEVEETLRFNVFSNNLNSIRLHNKRQEQGIESFTVGINQYSDLLHSEFLRKMTGFGGLQKNQEPTLNAGLFNVFHSDVATKPVYKKVKISATLNQTVDWIQLGYVTPVKNQAACGSCWAFSSTGALEGQWFKKTKVLPNLSEQNLVDCTKNTVYNNAGCGGGWMNRAFDYVKTNKGINKRAVYPYTATDGTCKFINTTAAIGATCRGRMNIAMGNEMALQQAVSDIGPISIALDASLPSFQIYKSGVYNETQCSNSTLNHAMLAVGYGTLNNVDYWLLKNSWGTSWGEQGYMKLARNQKNHCGIASAASYPVV